MSNHEFLNVVGFSGRLMKYSPKALLPAVRFMFAEVCGVSACASEAATPVDVANAAAPPPPIPAAPVVTAAPGAAVADARSTRHASGRKPCGGRGGSQCCASSAAGATKTKPLSAARPSGITALAPPLATPRPWAGPKAARSAEAAPPARGPSLSSILFKVMSLRANGCGGMGKGMGNEGKGQPF